MIETVHNFYRKVSFKILLFFQRNVVIPSYEFKRAEIYRYIKQYNLKVLVETGTFQGDTVAYFKDKIPYVFSIELSEELASKAASRFHTFPNVRIIQGDSGEILDSLIKEIRQPTIFWLDGHYSSEFYIGDEYFITAKGTLNTPIIAEVTTILKDPITHAILIDDARLYVGKSDYPSIKQLRKLIEKINNKYSLTISNDIIYILPNAKASA